MAERAARAGGTIARQSFRGELRVETKADKNDLVTETDRDAQRQVLSEIREEFSADAIVAEEDALPVGVDADDDALAESIPDRGDAWVVDPIDGTTNFSRGLRMWATSVAAVVDGEPVGSATYLPAHGDVYAAGPDSATRDGTTLSVSDADDPETFGVGLTGRWRATEAAAFGEVCETLVANLGDVRRFGSMQATLAFLADGGLDAVVTTERQSPWDTLAGVHLVRSAGGTVTDLDGDPWETDSDGFVATNGEAHDAVLDAVRAAGR
jgi:myo-inositol-1(or 4)-monophosphatase